jgi:phenylacetate-CoA ligase
MSNWLTKSYWSAFVLWNLRDESRLPYWPLDKVLPIQHRRLRSIVTHAYRNVPYYREYMQKAGLRPIDFRSAEDLERLPLLTKEEMVAAPEQFRPRRHAGQPGLILQSSGTSGQAISIAYDKAALFLSLAHGHRQRLAMAHLVGRSVGYREAGISRPDGVSRQLRRFYQGHSWTPGHIDLERCHLSASSSFEHNWTRLNDFRPDVVRGYGSYLGVFFRWIHEQQAPFARPKLVVYGADSMSQVDRMFIEEELGIPVWSSYQATEALHIAFQCELRQGFHINLDEVAVRVMDRQGRSVGPGGTGELVLSNLTNRATVLLNLRLGDIVTLGKTRCACGRTLPTIDRIEGREDDLILMPDGSAVHPLAALEGLQKVPGVSQVQLVQEELGSFLLRVVCSSEVEWRAMRQRLETALWSTLGRDASLQIQQLDQIPPDPGGKVRAVVSHCQRLSGIDTRANEKQPFPRQQGNPRA